MESKKVRYIREESRTVVTRGGDGGNGDMLAEGTRLQLCRTNTCRDLITYSILDIVNNITLNTGNLLRE